ncbi:MAG: hypothetical protein UU47_C0032G0005 [candidate division TM6 bacterium GW2011_GWE2_41_16]|nr:MAG: hypothetical protein UU47_C0032G0005 [candidate division TM6 bacterium GW2011_GWE2_41_16]
MVHTSEKGLGYTLPFAMMLFTTFVLYAAIGYFLCSHSASLELVPHLKTIDSQEQLNAKHVPNSVDVGLFINNFSKFDALHGSFVFDGTLWFKADSTKVSVDQLAQFKFERGTILEKSQPYVTKSGNEIFVRYDIKVEFFSQLNYKLFPLDEHRISFVVSNKSLADSSIAFTCSDKNFVIKEAYAESDPEWLLAHTKISAGYLQDTYDASFAPRQSLYPAVSFVLDYARIGARNMAVVFLPLLLLFFITLFVFALDPSRYEAMIISIATGALSASIAYRLVIENVSPRVSYFTLADYIYLIFLLANFCMFGLSFLLKHFSQVQRKIVIIVLHSAVTISCLYVMLMW